MKFTEYKCKKAIYRFNADFIDDVEGLFSTALHYSQTGNSSRGNANIIEYKSSSLVLKHYHRGGAVARFSKDKYVWTGADRTRAFKELDLLRIMLEIELPVPVPVAARVIRNGIFYQCDLVTEKIENTQTLSEVLSAQHLSPADWKAIGLCIRKFHDSNVYHADLNASNILLDDTKKVFLIDFDKGELRKGGVVWKQEVLARLRRSLDKFSLNRKRFCYTDEDWSYLINAYTGYKVS